MAWLGVCSTVDCVRLIGDRHTCFASILTQPSRRLYHTSSSSFTQTHHTPPHLGPLPVDWLLPGFRAQKYDRGRWDSICVTANVCVCVPGGMGRVSATFDTSGRALSTTTSLTLLIPPARDLFLLVLFFGEDVLVLCFSLPVPVFGCNPKTPRRFDSIRWSVKQMSPAILCNVAYKDHISLHY